LFDREVMSLLDARAIVKRRNTFGGTSPRQVMAALKRARRSLGKNV